MCERMCELVLLFSKDDTVANTETLHTHRCTMRPGCVSSAGARSRLTLLHIKPTRYPADVGSPSAVIAHRSACRPASDLWLFVGGL